jgi:hypothetical protein
MRVALAVLCLTALDDPSIRPAPPGQDQKKDLKDVNEKMAKLKSYHFKVTVTLADEVKLAYEGEFFAPGLTHARFEKAEVARHGEKRMVKKDGEWKEAKLGRREEADPTLPHEWAAKMAEECGAVKREKSTKLGSTTADIYVGAPGGEAAKRLAEHGGSLLAGLVDWTKARNAILFYVGRDDRYHRIEQRFEGGRKEDKSGTIVMEFAEFDSAKSKLPEDVRKKLE